MFGGWGGWGAGALRFPGKNRGQDFNLLLWTDFIVPNYSVDVLVTRVQGIDVKSCGVIGKFLQKGENFDLVCGKVYLIIVGDLAFWCTSQPARRHGAGQFGPSTKYIACWRVGSFRPPSEYVYSRCLVGPVR